MRNHFMHVQIIAFPKVSDTRSHIACRFSSLHFVSLDMHDFRWNVCCTVYAIEIAVYRKPNVGLLIMHRC